MNTENLYEQLVLHEDKERAVQMKRYMRNQFEFLGLPAGLRKEIAKPYMAESKKSPGIDWDFTSTFWGSPYRECQYTVCDYLNLKKQQLTPDDIPEMKSLALSKPWWDTIDAIDKPIADIAKRHPEVNDILMDWSHSNSIWLRRIAIIHQRLHKEDTNAALLETVIVNNLNQKEFFINKAIGWALRAYSRTDPDWVRNFIRNNKDGLDRLSIREGSKYL